MDNYPRKQDVKKVYRKLGGEYILEDCVYTEDWNMEKKRSVAKDISGDDYVTYLAIEKDALLNGLSDTEIVRFASACSAVAISRFPLPLYPPKMDEVNELLR